MVTYPFWGLRKAAGRPLFEVDFLRLAAVNQYFSSLLRILVFNNGFAADDVYEIQDCLVF